MFFLRLGHLAFALPLVSHSFASPIASDASPSVPTITSAASADSSALPATTLSDSVATVSAAIPSQSFVAGPALKPATHWDHPVADMSNLAPSNSSTLYYSANGVSDPTVEHLFASMNTTFQYQSVVLNHSSLVDSVSCAPEGIMVKFADPKAFQYAANAWPSVQDFVLVTYTDGCGNSTDQRTFWLIDQLSTQNGTNSILAKVKQEIAVEDALQEVDMIWGTYHPADSNSTLSTRASNADLSKRVDKTKTKTAQINLSAPTGDASPWGNADLVFSETVPITSSNGSGGSVTGDIKLYCVDCTFQSQLTLVGRVKYSFVHGLEILTADMDGTNTQAKFQAGIVIGATWKDSKTQNLINEPIPDLGFSVAKIFEAGVYVTVDAVGTLELEGQGQALIGTTMTIPSFSAHLDIKDEDSGSDSTVSGFTAPQWAATPAQFGGMLSATAEFALPVGIHVGVKVPAVKFDKSIALVEQPSISGTIGLKGNEGGSCGTGLGWSVNAHNDITLDLFDIKTFTLEHYDSPPIAQGCIN